MDYRRKFIGESDNDDEKTIEPFTIVMILPFLSELIGQMRVLATCLIGEKTGCVWDLNSREMMQTGPNYRLPSFDRRSELPRFTLGSFFLKHARTFPFVSGQAYTCFLARERFNDV